MDCDIIWGTSPFFGRVDDDDDDVDDDDDDDFSLLVMFRLEIKDFMLSNLLPTDSVY